MSVLADQKIGMPRRETPLKPAFGQSYDAVAQIPQALETLSKQMASVQRMLKQHAEASRLRKERSDADAMHEAGWAERLHDRVDALLVEQRVTNMLLAELVATQKEIIRDDVTYEADQLRTRAYRRVRNGE